MKPKISLSHEQRKAQELFEKSWLSAIFITMMALGSVSVVVALMLRHFGYSSSPNFGLSTVGGLFIGQWWALRQVRLKGLSLESKRLELVQKTASDFSGETMQWRTPETLRGEIFRALTPFLLAGVGWGLWCWSDDFFFETLGILSCFFLLHGIVGLLFIRDPDLRIDEKGITGFQGRAWRRFVSWEELAQCEMSWQTNYLGQEVFRFLILKDGNGKVRLGQRFDANSAFSAAQFDQISAEIKRRMTGRQLRATDN